MTSATDDVAKRAIRAYNRSLGKLGLAVKPDFHALVVGDGDHDFVILRSGTDILATYRVQSDARLRRLKTPPKGLAELAALNTSEPVLKSLRANADADQQMGSQTIMVSETFGRPFWSEMSDCERRCFKQFAIRSMTLDQLIECIGVPDDREIALYLRGKLTDTPSGSITITVVVRAGEIRQAQRLSHSHPPLTPLIQPLSTSLQRRISDITISHVFNLIRHVIVRKSRYADAIALLFWLFAQESDVGAFYIAAMEHVARIGWDRAIVQAEEFRKESEGGAAEQRPRRIFSWLISELVKSECQNPIRRVPPQPYFSL
jgi:hypothetical protein